MAGVATTVTALQWQAVSFLPSPTPGIAGREYLHTNGNKYRCTGSAWLIVEGAGSGGTLDPNSPIIGLPPNTDTLTEIGTKLNALDANNNNRADGVDALDLTTLIAGAPPTLDTMQKLIAAVQSLSADGMRKSVYDTDNDSIVDSADGGTF